MRVMPGLCDQCLPWGQWSFRPLAPGTRHPLNYVRTVNSCVCFQRSIVASVALLSLQRLFCFVCSAVDGRCVEPAQCGCMMGNVTVEHGESVVLPDCQNWLVQLLINAMRMSSDIVASSSTCIHQNEVCSGQTFSRYIYETRHIFDNMNYITSKQKLFETSTFPSDRIKQNPPSLKISFRKLIPENPSKSCQTP